MLAGAAADAAASLGFVDLQVNGFGGVSFSEPGLTAARCAAACDAVLRRGGVAAFLPTIITADAAVIEANLAVLADAIESARFGGRLLGIHLEGPFISPLPGAIGCHPTACGALQEACEKRAGGPRGTTAGKLMVDAQQNPKISMARAQPPRTRAGRPEPATDT